MAYDRTHWKDHVTKRPRTYMEAVNEDKSVTHTPATGETLQHGTPQSASNFNNIEEALAHTAVAQDWFQCIAQATMRAQEKRIRTLERALDELAT